MRITWMAFLIAFSVCNISMSAFAAEKWKCTYRPIDDNTMETTTTFLMHGNIISGLLDEYGGKPENFDIIENSDVGFIAISHSSIQVKLKKTEARLVVLILNKETGYFRILGLSTKTKFMDSYSGMCEKKK